MRSSMYYHARWVSNGCRDSKSRFMVYHSSFSRFFLHITILIIIVSTNIQKNWREKGHLLQNLVYCMRDCINSDLNVSFRASY